MTVFVRSALPGMETDSVDVENSTNKSRYWAGDVSK